MKRSELKRKKGLGRGQGLARGKPLAKRSAKRIAGGDERKAVVEAVFRRDRGCLLERAGLGRCYGPLTPHHLRKEGQGGLYTLDNIVALCAFHNGWVEDEPDLAFEQGLVARRGRTPTGCWTVLLERGLVRWWPDGGPPAPMVDPL